MTKKLLAGSALLGLVLAGGLTGAVASQAGSNKTDITAQRAIEIALAEVPGEVIEVEREREDGMVIFEVEILGADGGEMEVEINAKTGDILGVEAEDEEDDHDDKDNDQDDETNDA